jgi:apolipoprotein D and lipocalin family protein
MVYRSTILSLAIGLFWVGCTGVPKGLEPVSEFDGNRYLGKWYEIARLDHSFERNLSNVTAEYTRAETDLIRVLNRGYNEKTGEWKQIEGKARFIADETVGSLKVSFFGPFYGGYHVIELDREGYRYAMVTGPSRSYLWILSRERALDEETYARLVDKATEMGFDTASLIKVKHDRVIGFWSPEEREKMKPESAKIFTPCPSTPNCVSSLADNKKQFISPMPYSGENLAVQQELLKILSSFNRVRVVTVEDDYIRAEFKSPVFGFVDDVEMLLDDVQKVIHVKSASRTGYSDLGVNRRRLEKVKALFDESHLSRKETVA